MANNEIKMTMSLVTAGVTKALTKAKQSVSNFASEANKKLGSVAKLVATGLTAAFVAFAKKAIDYGSAMSDMAEQNRISTDALQVLSAVAVKAGVGIQDITRAMRNANIRTQEAIDGNTKYSDALIRLNLNLDTFKNLPTERKLEEIAKAYKSAGKSQQAYTDVATILGTKAGPKMLEVLRRLADEGYENLEKSMKDAGLVMEESTIAAMDKAADAIEKFKLKATIKIGGLISGEADGAAFKALGGRFMALMAKVGGWMTNAFLDAIGHLTAGLLAASAVLGTNVSKGFTVAGLALQKAIAPAINALVEGLNNIGFDLEKMDVGAIQAKIDKISFNNPANEWSEFNQSFLDGMGDWSVSTQGQQDAWNEYADTQDRILATSGLVETSQQKRKDLAAQTAIDEAIAADAADEKAKAEALVAEKVRLQGELKEAIAKGDVEAAKTIEEALKREEAILKVMKDHNLERDQAAAYVDKLGEKERELAKEKNAQTQKEEEAKAKEIAQAEKMLGMERVLLDAVLSGDEMAARAAQKKIDLEQRAQQIMSDLKVDYEEAYSIAKKLAAIEAGPDLNDSGFVTRFEQREFDRQQKERNKILDKAAREEERQQRERGGNIPNVTNEKRDRQSVKEKQLADAERRMQKRENQAINRERDPERRKAMIEAADKRIADVKAGLIPPGSDGTGGGGLTPKTSRLDQQKAKNKALADKRETEKRLKGGEKLEDIQKDIANRNKPPGGIDPNGKAVDPNGKAPDPKKPDNPVVDVLGKKLDEQTALLTAIEKSLKC